MNSNEKDVTPAAGYYPDQEGVERWWDGEQWTEHTRPADTEAVATDIAARQTQLKPRRRLRWLWISLGSAAGLFAVLVAIGLIAGPQSDVALKTVPAPTSSTPVTPKAPAAPVAPTPSKPSAPAPVTPKATVKPSGAPKVTYDKLTARQWKMIAKDPDAHVGDTVIVYGAVTQFDAATGNDTLRADVDGIKHPVQFGFADYPTNVIMTASLNPSRLSKLVEGDIFRAKVTVMGSQAYDTQIGGSTTAPLLYVDGITRIGSTS